MRKTLLLIAISMAMVGCNNSAKKSMSAYYVYTEDIPLVGIDYQCGTQKGITDENGRFTFKKGDDCQFKVGDVKLRYTYSQELRDGMLLEEDNKSVVKFLKALSEKKNAIYISKETKRALEVLKIKEIPNSDVIFQVTIDAINNYQKSYKKLLSSI